MFHPSLFQLISCPFCCHSYNAIFSFSLFFQDYVDVQGPELLGKEESEYRETQCLQAASTVMDDINIA